MAHTVTTTNKNNVETSPGRPERPIFSKNDDKLERVAFVQRLTDALINPTNGQSTGVVIGITGPWGSGKSSILNLVSEQIKSAYKQAVVVRFDPWLVSGRNDLISQFISELIGAITTEAKFAGQFKAVTKTLIKYGEHLAPIGSLWIPFLGPIIKSTVGTIRDVQKSGETLNSLRKKLTVELAKVSVPIIVLIDEVDRIEDEEIRAVAQLVRSVADFPGISYALAYDPKRVIQALGTGGADTTREERGRAYLEKIVQLQIPLPATFDEEIVRMLTAELTTLQDDLQLPKDFCNIERYVALITILSVDIIQTPRDIARLVGTFHVLGGMLRGEVDWIDLLAYSALLVKAPQTVDVMRLKPSEFCEEIYSEAAAIRRLAQGKVPVAERLKKLIPDSENYEGTERLIGFIFPVLSKNASRRDDERTDALCRRRPLLTTLRLGLLPGTYSRSEVEALVFASPEKLAEALRSTYMNDTLTQLIDRIDDLYSNLSGLNHAQFWLGVGQFLRKPDCEWMTSYSPMHEVVRSFSNVLERAIAQNERLRSTAADVFRTLREAEEAELTAHWIRECIFTHGLFGREKRSTVTYILDEVQTKENALNMSKKWRAQHLAGKLIPCQWDLMSIYTMLDTGDWDDDCQRSLNGILNDDRVVDGLSLMFFGGHYSTEDSTVAKICDYKTYISRIKERLSSSNLHESVRDAMKKAENHGW